MLLLFNCWKCCAHMSRRNTSQRPPEPPQDRSDRFRAGKPAPTGRFQRKKKALRPPMAGRGKVGERDLVAVILLGDQRHRRVHPRRWTRHSISRIIRCMSKRMHCFKNQFGSAGRTGPTVNRMGVRFESLIGSTMQSNRWNPVRLGQNR